MLRSLRDYGKGLLIFKKSKSDFKMNKIIDCEFEIMDPLVYGLICNTWFSNQRI